MLKSFEPTKRAKKLSSQFGCAARSWQARFRMVEAALQYTGRVLSLHVFERLRTDGLASTEAKSEGKASSSKKV